VAAPAETRTPNLHGAKNRRHEWFLRSASCARLAINISGPRRRRTVVRSSTLFGQHSEVGACMGGRVLQSFVYVFIAFGVVFVAVGLGLAYHTYTFSHHAQQTTGVVIENIPHISEDKDGNKETYYYPHVRFRGPDGQEIVFEGDTGSSPPSHGVGATVAVLYDPKDPAHAMVKDWSMWLAAEIFALSGALFSGIGVGILAWRRHRERLVAWLRQHGKQIDASFTRVEQNTSITVNEAHPYRIVCQWSDPETHRVHVFKSEDFWSDPGTFTGQTIKVMVDPANWARYFVDTDFLGQADETGHHSLHERWAKKKEDYLKRWKALREHSLDNWLFRAYFLSVVSLFSLTEVSRGQELLFAAILTFGFIQFSLWHRLSVGWQWPGPQDDARRSILFIAGATALLLVMIIWLVPFSAAGLPWYLLIFGLAGYLVLKQLGVIADSEGTPIETRSPAKESTGKRAARLAYQTVFVLVWLAVMVAFCFKDYLLARFAVYTPARTLLGVATAIGWIGPFAVVLATPLLHYRFGVKIFPKISNISSPSTVEKTKAERSAA